MTDFFQPEKFKDHVASTEKCGGCLEAQHERSAPLYLQRELESMTGLDWNALSGPDGQLVTVPLRKDYRTLNLDTSGIPQKLPLCLPCIVEYMKTFNRLLQEKKGRDKACWGKRITARNADAWAKEDATHAFPRYRWNWAKALDPGPSTNRSLNTTIFRFERSFLCPMYQTTQPNPQGPRRSRCGRSWRA